MINDIGQMNYRKLLYFFENKVKVHFKDLDNIFYNGLILDLSEEKLTMVLQERVKGTMPILLEFVKPESIIEFREVER
jgi:hypothetical protein